MTVRSERPTLYWVPVCQTGHVWKNTYVKNGTNFSDTAVGFFMSLLCSICHLFPTAKVFKIVCQCFLQVIALAIAPVWISILRICVSTSVSQNFSPLKLVASKTTRRKGGTWANMRESEANPTHPCHESFVPFLQEHVTWLAHGFVSSSTSYDVLWQGHWATNIGNATQ